MARAQRVAARNLRAGDVVRLDTATLKVKTVTVLHSGVIVEWFHATEGERLDGGTALSVISRADQ